MTISCLNSSVLLCSIVQANLCLPQFVFTFDECMLFLLIVTMCMLFITKSRDKSLLLFRHLSIVIRRSTRIFYVLTKALDQGAPPFGHLVDTWSWTNHLCLFFLRKICQVFVWLEIYLSTCPFLFFYNGYKRSPLALVPSPSVGFPCRWYFKRK